MISKNNTYQETLSVFYVQKYKNIRIEEDRR